MNPISATAKNIGGQVAPAAQVKPKEKFATQANTLTKGGRGTGEKPKAAVMLGKDPIEHNREELVKATGTVNKIIDGKNMSRAEVIRALAEIQVTADQGGNVVQEVTEALLASFDYLDEECSELSKAIVKLRKDSLFGDEAIIDILESSEIKMRSGENMLHRGLFKIKDKVVNLKPMLIQTLLIKSALHLHNTANEKIVSSIGLYKMTVTGTVGVITSTHKIIPFMALGAAGIPAAVPAWTETGANGAWVYTFTAVPANTTQVWASVVVGQMLKFDTKALWPMAALLVDKMSIKFLSAIVLGLGIDLAGLKSMFFAKDPEAWGLSFLSPVGDEDQTKEIAAQLTSLTSILQSSSL